MELDWGLQTSLCRFACTISVIELATTYALQICMYHLCYWTSCQLSLADLHVTVMQRPLIGTAWQYLFPWCETQYCMLIISWKKMFTDNKKWDSQDKINKQSEWTSFIFELLKDCSEDKVSGIKSPLGTNNNYTVNQELENLFTCL